MLSRVLLDQIPCLYENSRRTHFRSALNSLDLTSLTLLRLIREALNSRKQCSVFVLFGLFNKAFILSIFYQEILQYLSMIYEINHI